jgi:hypothetical protein
MHDREKMKDKTSTTLIAIGTGLIGIQMVEHLLDLLLHTVFRTERMLSTRELEKLGKLERYETLGNLLEQLRTKVELHPDLELYFAGVSRRSKPLRSRLNRDTKFQSFLKAKANSVVCGSVEK